MPDRSRHALRILAFGFRTKSELQRPIPAIFHERDSAADPGEANDLRVRIAGSPKLQEELVGGGPVNRDAVGARVELELTDGRSQIQEVKCGSSSGSGNDMRLHFGLGEAEIASIYVRWPDGHSERVDDIETRTRTVLYYPE